MQHLHMSNVHFSFPGQDRQLFSNLSLTFSTGWTGVVGGNGTGKTTLLRLISGDLHPDEGSIRHPEPVIVCEQRTDSAPEGLGELCSFPDAEAGRIVSILEIEGDWPYRWQTLSQGERKRAQIADALWRNPAVLLLDEPSNHLDRQSRGLVREALLRFGGVGVLVSHDRDLLGRTLPSLSFLRRY
jgi:macrolide transport system ATP-binding/permease protein